jgi:RNA polymerase sigma-70 factor (ECF subfamily)
MSMTQPNHDAGQWLPAARAGSREALGKVLEMCRRYLLAIAERELDPALRAKGGASDLVSETFLDAQRLFDRFQGDSEAELRAWLRKLLLNNLGDFSRHYQGTLARDLGREVPLQPGSTADGPRVPADSATPSRVLGEAEQAEALRRAVERLPEDYRAVLAWRYQDALSFEEIGQRLGRTANAARKLWLRAVQQLQQELEAPS